MSYPMADFLRKPPALPGLKLLTTKILKVLTKFSTVLLDKKVSKVDYSLKAKGSYVNDFLLTNNTVREPSFIAY